MVERTQKAQQIADKIIAELDPCFPPGLKREWRVTGYRGRRAITSVCLEVELPTTDPTFDIARILDVTKGEGHTSGNSTTIIHGHSCGIRCEIHITWKTPAAIAM